MRRLRHFEESRFLQCIKWLRYIMVLIPIPILIIMNYIGGITSTNGLIFLVFSLLSIYFGWLIISIGFRLFDVPKLMNWKPSMEMNLDDCIHESKVNFAFVITIVFILIVISILKLTLKPPNLIWMYLIYYCLITLEFACSLLIGNMFNSSTFINTVRNSSNLDEPAYFEHQWVIYQTQKSKFLEKSSIVTP